MGVVALASTQRPRKTIPVVFLEDLGGTGENENGVGELGREKAVELDGIFLVAAWFMAMGEDLPDFMGEEFTPACRFLWVTDRFVEFSGGLSRRESATGENLLGGLFFTPHAALQARSFL